MTPEQRKHLHDLLDGVIDGRELQYSPSKAEWTYADAREDSIEAVVANPDRYRIKPEPVTLYWYIDNDIMKPFPDRRPLGSFMAVPMLDADGNHVTTEIEVPHV